MGIGSAISNVESKSLSRCTNRAVNTLFRYLQLNLSINGDTYQVTQVCIYEDSREGFHLISFELVSNQDCSFDRPM